ncbi:cytochrome C [Chryseobacterium foetidum]|uniref:cytochrome C n=1 Tax=Chryseobacterium foetidum TaxID=2951057 RepID=UPI0021C98D6A|nr:cytochrome C [Chryseobacterium foetidum]
MKKLIGTSLLAALLFASCTPKAVVATTTAPAAATSTSEQLAQGKTIFENSCKKCHGLPKPDDFTSVEWVGIMNSMAPKARLTDEQHQWVYDYIVSAKTK